MRLLDTFQKEDYQPLERGQAIPQFYENGDRYICSNAYHWSWRFWYWLSGECRFHPYSPVEHDRLHMLLMGGEL